MTEYFKIEYDSEDDEIMTVDYDFGEVDESTTLSTKKNYYLVKF